MIGISQVRLLKGPIINHKLHVRLGAALLTGAATVALVCAGTVSAQADVASPRAGAQTTYSFTVQEPGNYNRISVPVVGEVSGLTPTMTSENIYMSVWCDGTNYPVHKSARFGQNMDFDFTLPLSLVGHVCQWTVNSDDGRNVWLSPGTVTNDKGKSTTELQADLITVVPPRRGGQY